MDMGNDAGEETVDLRYTVENVLGMVFQKVSVMEFVFEKVIVPIFTLQISASSSVKQWSRLFSGFLLTGIFYKFIPLALLLSRDEERKIYPEAVCSHIKWGELEDESKIYVSLFSPREYFYGSFMKSSVLFYMRKLFASILYISYPLVEL